MYNYNIFTVSASQSRSFTVQSYCALWTGMHQMCHSLVHLQYKRGCDPWHVGTDNRVMDSFGKWKSSCPVLFTGDKFGLQCPECMASSYVQTGTYWELLLHVDFQLLSLVSVKEQKQQKNTWTSQSVKCSHNEPHTQKLNPSLKVYECLVFYCVLSPITRGVRVSSGILDNGRKRQGQLNTAVLLYFLWEPVGMIW